MSHDFITVPRADRYRIINARVPIDLAPELEKLGNVNRFAVCEIQVESGRIAALNQPGSTPAPDEPTLFIKANSAISGPDDPIARPPGAVKLDYEVELAAVIGRAARSVGEARALGHVTAYCLLNDVSEREFQMEHGGGTTKGKSADTFAPIGPWLVTADEIPDPQALSLWTTVNGERRQHGHTKDMVFSVAHLIAYVSRFMTLLPGDLLSTGTPAGVGHGARPPRYLQPGDTVEQGIDGLGRQRHRVTQRRA